MSKTEIFDKEQKQSRLTKDFLYQSSHYLKLRRTGILHTIFSQTQSTNDISTYH
ncbi:14147_t:CDS:2 [Ambispora leptoticha]|uniref:14147_t:CDS:1 n=1 Tax=Ambispora leptoticha TaxID=144679 RepID=A0A9N9BW80_9GLOM|nr:14147_t:CDS:2 [Ambispora leptoticha]